MSENEQYALFGTTGMLVKLLLLASKNDVCGVQGKRVEGKLK
jgi:hypothetical protein